MTQPVGLSSGLNYTPYNPDLDLSQSQVACGGAGGGGGSGGTEGAGGVASAPPVPQDDLQCISEMMKTASACGAAYLVGRVPTPLSLLAGLNCAANVLDLVECVTAPAPKLQED